MATQQSDEEYASHISEAFWSDDIAPIVTAPRIPFGEAKNYFRNVYGIEIDQSAWMSDQSQMSSKFFLDEICEMARNIVPQADLDAKLFVVRFVPNWAINAQIIINPKTENPIIFINAGIVGNIQLGLNVYSAIAEKNQSVPLSAYSFEQLYDEFIEVAEISVHGLQKGVANPALSGSSVKFGSHNANRNHGIVYMAASIEIFLILHEFAHIMLGHVERGMDKEKLKTAPPANSEALHFLDRPIAKEVAADIAAIKWLLKPQSGSGLDLGASLYVLGFYLLYLDLCQAVDRRNDFDEFHGEPDEYLHRWEAAKQYFGIEKFQHSPAWDLDVWFSRIRSRLAFKRQTRENGTRPPVQTSK